MDADLPQGEVLVIIDTLAVHDPDLLAEYQQVAREQMARWGGRAVARGSAAFEGEFGAVSRLVQHWASAQDFYDWQASEEYAPWKEARRKAVTMNMIVSPKI